MRTPYWKIAVGVLAVAAALVAADLVLAAEPLPQQPRTGPLGLLQWNNQAPSVPWPSVTPRTNDCLHITASEEYPTNPPAAKAEALSQVDGAVLATVCGGGCLVGIGYSVVSTIQTLKRRSARRNKAASTN